LIARYVREEGLIATGGRGTSAATMSARDAVNLLIGVNATTHAADAVKIVSAYRRLESYEFRAKGDPRPRKKYGTFGEALEHLIHAISAGELPEIFLHREVPRDLQEAFPAGDVRTDITFRKSNLSASMKITPTLGSDLTEMSELMLEEGTLSSFFFKFDPPKLRGPSGKRDDTGDRTEEVKIGYRTLSAVGQLLRSNG
jgi:hypothetical protein